MKKILLFLFLLTSCLQKETDIVYKSDGQKSDAYTPSYLKSSYDKNNKYSKFDDLKVEETYSEKQEDDVEEKEKNKVEKVSSVIVEKGDSLLFYARKYNTTVDEIARINNLKKPYNIYIGQKLKINDNSSDKNAQQNNKNLKTVSVQPGDNLLKLSVKYNTTLRELAEINNINAPYNIYVGQKIKVPDFEKYDYSQREIKNDNKSNTMQHVVESGDNIFYIAKKYNTTANELINLNNLKKPYNIYIGQKLLIKSDKKNNVIAVEKNNKIEKVERVEAKKEEVKTLEVKPSSNVINTENQFKWPITGEILKKFGDQVDGKSYDGILIKAEKKQQITASEAGEIIYAANELKDLGNVIIVKHDNKWLSIYGHCETLNVKVKDVVKKGDVIALAGKTGKAESEQVYFAIRRGRTAVDPLKYLIK